MKILWFNRRDIRNPESGGAEVYTHEIARRLVMRGYSITLFSSKFKGCRRREVIDGVEVVRDGGKYTVYQRAREFYRKNRGKFDLVIDEITAKPFHTPRFVSECGILALIHHLAREVWFYETPLPLGLIGYFVLEKRWLKDYVDIPTVTVSNSTKRDLRSMGFKSVFIVYNGVNVKPVEKIPEKEEDPTIVFVGRMTRAKKPQDVIKAFNIVKREVRDAKLWMVGDGYLRRKLESKAKDVKFFGYVDSRVRDSLVSRAWVIAVPGVREGWAQVVTDANALGTPAIGYDIPGLRDSIKNGFNGILVEGNPKALANGIINLISDDRLRRRLSRNAIRWARKFSWDRSAEVFESIIKMVA